jgi:hypothetical protein
LLKVIRHRPVQACVIAALSALVTACAVFTPLYQRALDQASVHVELDHAAPGADALQLTSDGVLPSTYTGQQSPVPALPPAELVELVPPSVRRSFRAPVIAVSVNLTTPAAAARPSEGTMVWRAHGCAHLELAAGSCPTAAQEIAVSTTDAENFELGPGSQVPVVEKQPLETLEAPAPPTVLTVTGVYRPPTDPYWAGWDLVGASGATPDRGSPAFHDSWITDQATFRSPTPWKNPSSRVDLPVDSEHIGVDELLRLGPALERFQRQQERRPTAIAIVRARSGLSPVADRVREAQEQSRITIPALMVPLGLLGLVVLWMALGAGADQRRPEVAVARLRGRGVGGARAHLLRELIPIVLAGVPLGVLAALALSWQARNLLPGDVPLEIRTPFWLALALSLAAVTATAALVSEGISREPIVALLRRVPARRPGWGLGTVDAVVATVAASILGAFLTGRLTGPVALAAPAVLALAAGLVLARLLAPLATGAGRRLLGRGGTGPGVALLQLARRPGLRSTIALLTVSAAILLFAADAVAVGSRNRSLAAAQEVGAPMVATVTGGTARSVREAVAGVDTGGTHTTAVVIQHPLSDEDQTNLFVDREAFVRTATFQDRQAAGAAVHRLRGPDIDPVEVVGRSITLDVATESFYEGSRREVSLAARLLRRDGAAVSVPLGTLPPGTSGASSHEAPIDCADGCVLIGWQLLTDPGNPGDGRVTISSVRTDTGATVDLGRTVDWTVGDTNGSRIKALDDTARSLTVFVANKGSSELTLAHGWVPATLPVVVSGTLPPDSTDGYFPGLGMDGVTRPMALAARLPWLPAATPNATLADLDLALRSGVDLGDHAELQVWFSREDGAALAAVTQALHARNVDVTAVHRVSAARRLLDDSASAWSMQLGVLVGIACLLVAGLGLAIAGAASWRTRARDLAILRLNGLTGPDVRRVSLGEQLPMVVVSVLAGAGVGVLAAHYALPTLPLLPADPQVDLIDLSAAWGVVLVLVGVAAVVLCTVGAAIAALVARRASPERVVAQT